ncbi:MAG: signal peptide peptidase SppA [Breznakibacter sp.]
MAKFFKYLLATFVGGLVAALFLFVILLGFIGGIVALSSEEVVVKDNSILLLRLNGPIVERLTPNPIQDLFDEMSDKPQTEGLNQILSNIDKAKRDPKIKGILLDGGMLSAGYATIEEIRNALGSFKESGKFVYAYGTIYTQKAYYLASVADKVYVTPSGMVQFSGIYSERMFFKGTLEKLGVEMQVFKVGKFKSAVEPFIEEKMSDPAREQTQVYINSIWAHVLDKVSESRNIDKNSLNQLANQMPMFLDPQLLVDNGLVDGLKYKDELLVELKDLTNTSQSDDLASVTNKQYVNVFVEKERKGLERDKIAVIYASGDIDGTSSDGIKSDDLSRTIREARRDSSVKAIVLRINSPGGSALGSEIIWREVKLAKETKPVVVSMGDLAASGGYYIACAADTIVAHPTTLTGSIGIFGIIPNAQGLFNKIGITFDGAKTNQFSDMPDLARPFRPEEKALMQAYVERGYQLFTQRCADGRKTTRNYIDSIGQGRVWAGQKSVDIKLVDKLGGINDAIAVAKDMAKLDNYKLVELPAEEDPLKQFLKGAGGGAKAWAIKTLIGDGAEYLNAIEELPNNCPIQARLPYQIHLN